MIELSDIKNPIILFDGVCNLCSSIVQFIIKCDPKHKFRFASLQSDFGKNIFHHFKLPVNELNSFILLEKGKIYTKSTGALKVVRHLKGFWPLMYTFIIIPVYIRDAVYNFIAKNRYRWFGKKEACRVPVPELQRLFMNDVSFQK
jgi:predicted DCC family thiol-disulfide oxidoreductase YuxK